MKGITRKDLLLDYSWKPEREHDNKWIQGFPNIKTLDRNEGYEVVPFLKRYIKTRNYSDIKIFHKLEHALRQMPPDKKTHLEAKEWLDLNCCF